MSSVKLVRTTSDTPNITNKYDARMIRYAYGGDGVVPTWASGVEAIVENGIFHLKEGLVVLQGWEIRIGGAGWSIDLSSISGTQYHLVYVEVNASTEQALIKSGYLNNKTPTISSGDDLTAAPNGTARYPLYSFKVTNGAISDVAPVYNELSHTMGELTMIKKELDKLGF